MTFAAFQCVCRTALWGERERAVASYQGLLTPAFVACSTSPALVLQATKRGVRRPGYEAKRAALWFGNIAEFGRGQNRCCQHHYDRQT